MRGFESHRESEPAHDRGADCGRRAGRPQAGRGPAVLGDGGGHAAVRALPQADVQGELGQERQVLTA